MVIDNPGARIWTRFLGSWEFRGEGCGVILFWVRWRVRKRMRKERANAEDAEFAEVR